MAILRKVEKAWKNLPQLAKAQKGKYIAKSTGFEWFLQGFCGFFELSHNLEVVGSNPAPATSLFG